MLSKIVEELVQVSSSKVLVFQILKTWGQIFFQPGENNVVMEDWFVITLQICVFKI